MINPSVHASWRILDRYSHDATKKRKLNQRNRMVLGNNDDSDIMSEEEMVILQRGCLSTMDKLEATPGHRFPLTIAESWQRCFISLLFLDLIGPRSQTMSSLSTDTVLRPNAPNNTSAGLWQVRIPAEKSKSGQPVLMDVPALLSPRFEILFDRVLPPDWTGPLFVTRNGKVRTDFTDMTRPTTTIFLGRPINPHRFRTSISTMFNQRQDVAHGLMRGLADHMSHTSEVQQRFYVRAKRLKTGAALQRIIMEGVAQQTE